MPSPRPSGSSRPSRPSAGRSGGREDGVRRTTANERRTPARPKGENPYKRKADGTPKSRAGAKRTQTDGRGGEGRRRDERRGEYRRRDEESTKAEPPKRKGWGSLARKGAGTIKEEGPGRRSSREEERQQRPRAESESWEIRREDVPRRKGAKAHKTSTPREPIFISPEAIREIEERVNAKRAERFIRLLRDAARAYASERWSDARKALRPLMAEVADAPTVQELDGMVLYRTGKWAAACKQLEAAHSQTHAYDLYPAMMDCRRALRQYKKVDQLWAELKEASPSSEVLAEGRIVYAAHLADRDRLEDAIRLLEAAPRSKRDPKPHHLRSWYLLGDLYERAGDVGKARMSFERVARYDEGLADVLERLEALD